MIAVYCAVVLCSVCAFLSGCGGASTTTITPSTSTTTTTRPGAQAKASLGSPGASSGHPDSLLELKSGALAVKQSVPYENDFISLFDRSIWEDALANDRTNVAYKATLALPGTSVGASRPRTMREFQGGILAAGAYMMPDIANNYGVYLFDSALINDALTNGRTNVSSRASLAVIEDGVLVHALQELQDGHLAVSMSAGSHGKILLFHREQIEDAIAMNHTGVEARASLAGWEVDDADMNLHALQPLQGGHLAVGVKGGIQLFGHALVEDALANNRTNVPANAVLAGPRSDTDVSALEELQGGHLAAATGFYSASGGILLFDRQVIEDALSNNRTGVKARANLGCDSNGGADACSFWSLQELQGGHLAAGDFSRGIVLFSNASVGNALANDQANVSSNGLLAGNSVVALQELSWTGQDGNLAVAMQGHAVPVFGHAIIKDALAANQNDVMVV